MNKNVLGKGVFQDSCGGDGGRGMELLWFPKSAGSGPEISLGDRIKETKPRISSYIYSNKFNPSGSTALPFSWTIFIPSRSISKLPLAGCCSRRQVKGIYDKIISYSYQVQALLSISTCLLYGVSVCMFVCVKSDSSRRVACVHCVFARPG